MRIKTWILALLLLAALFLLYRWLTAPQEDILTAQQQLVASDPGTLHTIHIERPQGERLSFTRENNKWLVTDGKNSSWVAPADMQALLDALPKMRPLGFRQNEQVAAPRITIQLLGGQKEVFQLSQIAPDTAFFHFSNLPEAYLIPAALAQPFFRTMHHYQAPTLLAWDTPDSIRIYHDSLVLRTQRDTLNWSHPPLQIDSVRWMDWLYGLSQIQLPDGAERVERLLPDSLADRSLQIWDGGERARVLAFDPEVAGDLPLIWTSRYPDRYFTTPDSAWYRQLFPVWLDSLANSVSSAAVQ